MRLARAGLAAFIAVLLAAPVAQAAYAPRGEIKIDPLTSAAPVSIQSRILQASGETASKTIRLALPAGFTIATKVQPCTPEQEQADACPPASQVGTARSETDVANLEGPVFLGQQGSQGLRLVVSLSGLGGLVKQKTYGDLVVTAGRAAVVFDNLPNTPSTLFQLDLQGGDKAVAQTSKECGKGSVDAQFTSQDGEQAASQVPVEVSGCNTVAAVSAVRVRPKAFRAVRKFSDSQRAGFGTTLAYTLSEATNGSRIKVQKRVAKVWRTAGSFIAGGEQGANSVRFDGRVRGKPLRPGPYRFLVQTTGKSGARSKAVPAAFVIR